MNLGNLAGIRFILVVIYFFNKTISTLLNIGLKWRNFTSFFFSRFTKAERSRYGVIDFTLLWCKFALNHPAVMEKIRRTKIFLLIVVTWYPRYYMSTNIFKEVNSTKTDNNNRKKQGYRQQQQQGGRRPILNAQI